MFGGYILNLHCDVPGCIRNRQVTSLKNMRAALKTARAEGWVVNTKSRRVRCSAHKHYRPYVTNDQARKTFE